jgi:hypothetical protein
MRVPVYNEIKLKGFSLSSIKDDFRKSKVGTGPFYIDLTNHPLEEPEEVFAKVIKALQHFNINQHFPYPFYIISERTIHDSFLKIFFIKSVKELPKYYLQKNGQIKSKESELLHKVEVLFQRIQNSDINTNLPKLKEAYKNQRHFYDLSRETAFLEEVFNELEKDNEILYE